MIEARPSLETLERILCSRRTSVGIGGIENCLIRVVVLNDLKHLVKFTKLVTVEVDFLALWSSRPLFFAHLVAPFPPATPATLRRSPTLARGHRNH